MPDQNSSILTILATSPRTSANLSVFLVRNSDDGGVDDVVRAEKSRLEYGRGDLVHPVANWR